MRGVLAIALGLTHLLAGCGAPVADPYARAPDGVDDKTIEVPHEQVAYPPFGSRAPMHVVASFQVQKGGPIDAWIADKATCGKFGLKTFAPEASALGTANGTLTADLPAGDACLILDNTDFALGKVNSTGNVTVHYHVAVWT